MNLKLLAPFFLVALVGAGCAGPTPTETPKPVQQKTTQAPSVMVNEHATSEHVAKAAGTRVDLKNRNAFKPGDIDISFKLYGEDSHPFGSADLKVEHDKKMHLILVRDDMTQFQHIHPEFKDGLWSVKTNISKQGTYQMYIDITPIEETASVLRVPITVGGETVDTASPQPNDEYSAIDAGYKAVLIADQPFRTKELEKWTFYVTKNGQPVKDIQPYLAAFGHVVELRHTDADDFFHVHPVTETKPTDGNVVFEGTFPTKGRYTLYAQFNIGGTVYTFPITVDVSEEGVASVSKPPGGTTVQGHGE